MNVLPVLHVLQCLGFGFFGQPNAFTVLRLGLRLVVTPSVARHFCRVTFNQYPFQSFDIHRTQSKMILKYIRASRHGHPAPLSLVALDHSVTTAS
jgi:hypothetical protein